MLKDVERCKFRRSTERNRSQKLCRSGFLQNTTFPAATGAVFTFERDNKPNGNTSAAGNECSW